MKSLKIEVPSRISINLIDTNGEFGRLYGSVGFALASPKLIFTMKKSKSMEVKAEDSITQETTQLVMEILKKLEKTDPECEKVKVIIHQEIPRHRGFGSGSITRLAITDTFFRVNNIIPNETQISNRVRKYNTSGASSFLYKHGGFCFDLGRDKIDNDDLMISASKSKVPKAIGLSMPEWPMAIITPIYENKQEGGYDEKEKVKEMFSAVTTENVDRLCRIITTLLLPSIVEDRLDLFTKAINWIQDNSIWKKAEINIYPGLKDIIQDLHKKGYAAGMTSIGPSIYVLGENLQNLDDVVAHFEMPMDIIYTKPTNTGIIRQKN